MWRLILKWLFGKVVVITTDFDGEERWRVVYNHSPGKYMVRGTWLLDKVSGKWCIDLDLKWLILNKNGTISKLSGQICHYTKRWRIA